MNQTLNLLTVTLGSIQIIDILIAIGLYFSYKRNTDYLIVTIIWVGMCFFFTGDHLLGDLGLKHIYLSYSFTSLSGIGMGLLVSRHYNVNFSGKKCIIFFISCLLTSGALSFFGIRNFTVLSLILSLGITGPVFYAVINGFKNLRTNKENNANHIDYIYLLIILIWGLHFLDYPFLRPLADLKFSIFGFSFALLITYLTSILFPVIINRKIHSSFNENLEVKLAVKSKELESAQQQIIAKEKLASLGTLSAGIAHEIKNPLNIIKNGTHIINKFSEKEFPIYRELIEAGDNNKLKAKLENDYERIQSVSNLINKNVIRADNIIKSMLEHSRTGKAVLSKVQLNKIITESLQFVIDSTKSKYQFQVKSIFNFAQIEVIDVYEIDLGRALINLFDNSLYAMNEKRLISKQGDYIPLIKIETVDSGQYITIIISDNGSGISEDKIDEILNPFFTTKPSGEGTGLGLSMVYDVLKLHEGDVNIESEFGKSSKFTLRLSKYLKKY